MSRAQLEVRRSVGLAGAITVGCAVVAALFGGRALRDGSWLNWLLAAGFALAAIVWALCMADARSPLLVVDRQGIRLRFADQWVGMPWGQLDGVEHRPGITGWRDGRLVPLGVNPEVLELLGGRARLHARLMGLFYGSPFAVPLGLTTRVVGAGDDLNAALNRLTAGAVGMPGAPLAESSGESSAPELAVEGQVEGPTAVEAEPSPEPAAGEAVIDPLTAPLEEWYTELPEPGGETGPVGKRRADVPADWQPNRPELDTPSWDTTGRGGQSEPTSALAEPTAQVSAVVRPLLRDPRPVMAAGLARLAELGRPSVGGAWQGGSWPTVGANALAYEPVVLAEALPEETREVHGLAKQVAAAAETEVLSAEEISGQSQSGQSQSGQPQSRQAATATGPQLGIRLRRARNSRSMSKRQVAECSGIPVEVVTALEADDFEPSGGDFYVRGQVRTLGRVLGFDAEPLIADYDRWFANQEIDASRVHGIAATPAAANRGRTARWVLLGVLLATVLIAAANAVS